MTAEIEEIFSKNGFNPGPIIIDGRHKRFKVPRDSGAGQSGFYIIREYRTSSGEVGYAGKIGDWHDRTQDVKINTFRFVKANDAAEIEKIFKKIEKECQEEQSRVWEETSKATTDFWKMLPEKKESDHPYLIRKQIPYLYGCKIQLTPHGQEILVPLRDVRDKFWGFQKINEEGKKFFFPGVKKLGNFHLLGTWGPKILVCEGFATGASLHMATDLPVAIAFDTSNLMGVSKQIREYHPEASIFICGDDDRHLPNNPGRKAAEAAAEACLGTSIFPKFSNLENKLSDFNDLHCLEGLDAVRNQVLKEEGFRPILNALGYDKDGNYFYTSSKNKAITALKTHTKSDLFRLFPFEYWEALYKPEGKGGIQWDKAAATLMDLCHDRGIYNPTLQRGYGIWSDQGRIVIHLGDRLSVDGKEVGLHEFKSTFVYELLSRLDSLEKEPLSISEMEPFLKKIQQISFKNHQSYIFFLGWLATSMVAGAIPWRTHIWMKGDRGSGKTSIFEYLNYILASAYRCIYRTQKTTEAHLRSVAGSSVIPILIDEFEGHKDHRESTRVGNILDLFRQAASDSEASVGKSSASHKSFSFTVKFSGAVGSITHELEDPADKSRFVMVDFDAPQHSAEDWKKLKSELYSFSPQFFRRLFKRFVKNLPLILENYLALKSAIQMHYGQDARTGDQYGTLLSGYAAFHYDGALSAEEAREMAGIIEWNPDASSNDAEDRLKWLLGIGIKTDGAYSTVEALYNTVRADKHSTKHDFLKHHGIKVMEDDSLFISTEPHGELDKLLNQSPWKKGFVQGLEKLEGVQKNIRTMLFGQTRKRGFTIPAEYFNDSLATSPTYGQPHLARLK